MLQEHKKYRESTAKVPRKYRESTAKVPRKYRKSRTHLDYLYESFFDIRVAILQLEFVEKVPRKYREITAYREYRESRYFRGTFAVRGTRYFYGKPMQVNKSR